jgi:inner membrane protein
MATVISHGIVGFVSARLGVRQEMPKAFWYLTFFAPMAPDLDAIGLKLGIPYADCLGHRGASHSIVFAAFLSVVLVLALQLTKAFRPESSKYIAAVVLFLAVAEHGMVDAMTNGGLGVAFFWPISCKRYFFDFRPIQVSPLGAARFLDRSAAIASSELRWLVVPCLVLLLLDSIFRSIQARRAASGTSMGS